MAKMRVHELAKELDIKSQDVIDVLNDTEYAVKSAQSGVDDAAQELVRNKFSKAKEAPKAEKIYVFGDMERFIKALSLG